MFGLFKRKTTTEKLHDKYKSLIKQAYNLSKSNRSQSDQKYYEARDLPITPINMPVIILFFLSSSRNILKVLQRHNNKKCSK